jgi:hypothetical protein
MATKNKRGPRQGATATAAGRPASLEDLQAATLEKEYVPRSAGLRAGATGDDVDRLQQYLTEFGYLESTHLDAFGVRARHLDEVTHEGEFDEATEIALRRFQQFVGLEPTGELDEATLRQMAQPRCGFPDTAEFVLQGSKWNKTQLTYAFQNFSPDLSQAQIRSAIQQAFGLWAAVTPLTFKEVSAAVPHDILIRFASGNHGCGSNFDGVGGVLAHAYYPPPGGGSQAGDTHFDESELWTVNLPPTGIDLVTVAAHEFGHALGLAHSTISGALMYPYYGGAHRKLEADDVAGIQALYGAKTKWKGWVSHGGVLASSPGVASWAPNRLDVFVRGTNNACWQKYWSGGWSGWGSLGGVLTSAPAAVSRALGRIDIVGRGTDNAYWLKSWNGVGWSVWGSLGGVLTSDPAICSWGTSRLDVFGRGSNNALWHRAWAGAGWTPWTSLGGVLTSAPAAVSWGPNRIDVFARGTDNALWHRAWNGVSWSGWSSLGGVLTSAPAVASWAPGRLDVFVRGTDSACWHKYWQGAWSGWSSLGGVITSAPGAVSWGPDRIDVFARGTDNACWQKWWS